MLTKSLIYLYITAGLFILTGCGFYSHTGASVPSNAKTFSVEYINNVASIVMPSLSQVLTEKLKSRFINETTLKLTQQDGDVRFSGKILNYSTSPVAVQGNQQNAVNRLTVTIEITYQNTKDETKNFTQQFSNFVDYPASENFSAVEIDLVNKVTDILVQDVFNKAFINW
jgi:outer membrane lipopolysaccharide assembly protein LptE/RlpB